MLYLSSQRFWRYQNDKISQLSLVLLQSSFDRLERSLWQLEV